MKIVEIKVKQTAKSALPLLATVSVNFDNEIIVRGLKIIRDTDTGSMFVAWPAYKNKDGKHIDIVYAINEDFMNRVSKEIIKEFINKRTLD